MPVVEGVTRPKEVSELEAKRRQRQAEQQQAQQRQQTPLPPSYWAMQPQTYKEQEQALLESGELKPVPSRYYSESEYGVEKPSPAMQTFIKAGQQEMVREGVIGYSVVGAVTLPVIAPAALPFVTAKTILIGEAVSVGATAVFSGGKATAGEYAESAFLGGAFAVVGSGVMAGVGRVTPVVYEAGLKGALSRIGVLTGLGGGASYVLSGGNLEATAKGAAFSAVFGAGVEVIGVVSTRYVKPAAERYLTRHYLETGELTTADKFLMKITGVQFVEKEYVVSGQPVKSWSKGKAESVYSKAVGKPNTEAWAKEALWSKPSGVSSSLNRYIGSGQAQQLIVKPVSVAEVVPRMAAVIVVPKVVSQKAGKKTSVLATTFTVSQVQNPFLKFAGKSYYRQKSREEEVYAVLSYPTQTPLSIPKQIQFTTPFQTPSLRAVQTPMQMPSLSAREATISMPQSTQIQRQAQAQTVSLKQASIQKQATSFPQFSLGGGEAGGGSFRSFFGKWTPRTHKVKTWEQQLKTFGVGKLPKGLSKLGKMEVPSFTKSKRRRKRR